MKITSQAGSPLSFPTFYDMNYSFQILTLLLAIISFATPCSGEAGKEELEVVHIWPQDADHINVNIAEKKTFKPFERVSNIHNPSLTVFKPKNPNGAAVVICPGGGYRIIATGLAGYPIAERLNKKGVTAFILKYRLPTTKGVNYKHPVPVSDALRAIQWVRHHSEEYQLDPSKVGIMGFSAGGHLAASAATLYDDLQFGSDAISKVASRPDFLCLGYSVISTQPKIAHPCVRALVSKPNADKIKGLSCELNVDEETPPTFIFHAKDDKVVNFQNPVVMHAALMKQGVESRMKLYKTGGHGFGLGKKGTEATKWFDDFVHWLGAQKIISSETEFYTPKEDLDGLTIKLKAEDGLPNVLLIGDSISIGYTEPVVINLKGLANVRRVQGNSGDTNKGLDKLDQWLGDKQWDVIHFNWGLHDLCYRHPKSKLQGKRDKVNGTQAVPLEDYAENLEELVKRLKETGATLIWASTTLIPEAEAGRVVGDEIKYNKVAAEIMERHAIRINDLHTYSTTITETFTKPGDVHFNKIGYQKLGSEVSKLIQSTIENTTKEK